MTKIKLKLKLNIDSWFLIVSGLLLLILIITSIFSIIFLGNHIFQGLSPLDEGDRGAVFDLDSYKELNLSE
ncbi:hypothetical protein KKH05_02830 [Patescibacteria group bacterium]|nr:hypothetical protein [Patescibacteria group bacterium]